MKTVTTAQFRRGLLRDAKLARKYAAQRPEHAEWALRVAALREWLADRLLTPTPEETAK